MSCPLHPEGGCGFSRHGTYPRKYPVFLQIPRYYCRKGRKTFSLLPDFLASRVPGTLLEIEQSVAVYESCGNWVEAADKVRSPDTSVSTGEPLTIEASQQWLQRRLVWVQSALLAAMGLLPERFGHLDMTIASFRSYLDTQTVLVELREILEEQLYYLPFPVGFGPRSKKRNSSGGGPQQRLYPTRPP